MPWETGTGGAGWDHRQGLVRISLPNNQGPDPQIHEESLEAGSGALGLQNLGSREIPKDSVHRQS